MMGSERLFTGRQAALQHRLGLGIAALLEIKHREVVEAGSNFGVIGPERVFPDCQPALLERLCLGVAVLFEV